MNPVKAYITYVEPNETHDGVNLKECKEVVLCEDCKHAIWDEVSKSHYCDFTETSVPAKGYCWRGKKQ